MTLTLTQDDLDAIAALIAPVQTAAENTWARVAGFNPATVVVQNPVVASGSLSVRRGDSYLAADGRSLAWTRTGWPSLSGWTVTLEILVAGALTSFAASATGSGSQTVTVELTHTQTEALVTCASGRFAIRAVKGSDEVTLLTGLAVITDELH